MLEQDEKEGLAITNARIRILMGKAFLRYDVDIY